MSQKSTLLHLPEDHWSPIVAYLRTRTDLYVGAESRCRRFVEAILWMARSGAAWRLLPDAYGNWNAVYKRFAMWSDKGIWRGLWESLGDDLDLEFVLMDSTIVRAHACAAGAPKEKGPQALGYSRGGFSSKIHLLTDALGNPFRVLLTGGQEADCLEAPELLKDVETGAVIADKGYDSQTVVNEVESQGAAAVIPPRSNRKEPREYDVHMYGDRHKIECTFGFFKHYRRVFSRFDKLASRFMSFIHFVGALIWLR